MTLPEHRPELLAPVGGLAQLEAAIHAAADAVYFGLDRGFNARVRAEGIPWNRLDTVMQQLHERGMRGFLTLNTLVFDEELTEAERHIRHAARCGVDALILQDIGIVRVARHTAPGLPLHASTQMSITDTAGVEFVRSLGIERVVLGRELSIDDIAAIHAQEAGIEIETFVHGALCASYSGQCFSSEAWGGRSANRGQRAQACRLPYGLVVDGGQREQGDLNYLLSPQDLMGMPWLPRLIRAGVRSFKIEGRLKGPGYVAATVRAYRQALDHAWQALQTKPALAEIPVETGTRRELAQLFSRGQDGAHDGLSAGFLFGPRHQELVIGRNPRHRGLHLGQVEQVTREGVLLTLHNPLKPGDGVVFDNGDPQNKEVGGNVYRIDRDGERVTREIDTGMVLLRFGRGFDIARVQAGDHVWRTRDAATDSGPRLGAAIDAGRLIVDVEIRGRANEPLRLSLSDRRGHRTTVQTADRLQPAHKRALDQDAVRKAFGQLGDTPFRIGRMELAVEPGLFLPLGAIKQARRQLVAGFRQALHVHHRDADMPGKPVLDALSPKPEPLGRASPAGLTLLCRTAEQVEAALALPGVNGQ